MFNLLNYRARNTSNNQPMINANTRICLYNFKIAVISNIRRCIAEQEIKYKFKFCNKRKSNTEYRPYSSN